MKEGLTYSFMDYENRIQNFEIQQVLPIFTTPERTLQAFLPWHRQIA